MIKIDELINKLQEIKEKYPFMNGDYAVAIASFIK